jgi:hypothetical protein
MPNNWSSRFRLPVLLACLLVCALVAFTPPVASADSSILEGGVSVWEHPQTTVDTDTAVDSGQLQPQTATIDTTPTPAKPSWIPGRVFTGPNSVMQTYIRITIGGFPTRIKRPWKPPDRGYVGMKLHKELMQTWREGCADVYVNLVPFGPPGNFYFVHRRPDGPRGFMEYIGKGENGCPNYRYWFQDDNPNSNNSVPIQSVQYDSADDDD